MAGALIVTAEFDGPDQVFLDRMRRVHFPPERNYLHAHLTIFHALPPSLESEVRARLGKIARGPRPKARIAGIMSLGSGVAFRIVSPDLESIRNELADSFHGALSAQDGQGWRPHVTIQNKVEERTARRLKAQLESQFEPRPLGIRGLGLHRYLGGPWDQLAIFPFRGVR